MSASLWIAAGYVVGLFGCGVLQERLDVPDEAMPLAFLWPAVAAIALLVGVGYAPIYLGRRLAKRLTRGTP